MTKHLYNPKDVAEVRMVLYDEQNSRDKLTRVPLNYKDAVLDHNHKTQYVRGVLHRQTNAALGKIENIWTRYLSTWYPGTLSDFLKRAAYYIDQADDDRFLHPAWIKKCKIEFNKLTAAQRQQVLDELDIVSISKGYKIPKVTGVRFRNDTARKEHLSKIILTKMHSFDTIMQVIREVKDEINHSR